MPFDKEDERVLWYHPFFIKSLQFAMKCDLASDILLKGRMRKTNVGLFAVLLSPSVRPRINSKANSINKNTLHPIVQIVI